jgi:hypothetical protein
MATITAAQALAGSSILQGFTAMRSSQAQAEQYRVQAQAAKIKSDFEARQNDIAKKKEALEIEKNQIQILKDTKRQIANNIALGAASGFLRDNVLNSQILEEGIEEYLTGQANLNLLESSFSIMGEMIERQGIDEAAQAQAAAVNTENLGLVQAGGYLAQGYLNYRKYDTETTET